MPRRLIPFVLAAIPAIAHAQPEPAPDVGEAPGSDVGARELGGSLGATIGGGATPGGARVEGAYLYQLSDLDWFDGEVALTFGGGHAACFRDRSGHEQCAHGVADGVATDLSGGFRRFFGGRPGFRPWIGPGLGLRFAYFSGDHLAGVGVIAAARGGIRARVNDSIAVGGQASVELGGALFGKGLGAALELDFVVGATVEFALN